MEFYSQVEYELLYKIYVLLLIKKIKYLHFKSLNVKNLPCTIYREV